MKRFLPFILIFSVVLQFFAPFTIGLANKKIQTTFTYAETAKVELYNEYFRTDKTIRVKTTIGNSENSDQEYRLLLGAGNNMMSIYLSVTLWDVQEKEIIDDKKITVYDQNIGKSFDFMFDKKLKEDREYRLVVRLYSEEIQTKPGFDGGLGGTTNVETSEIDSEVLLIKTLPSGNTTEESTGQSSTLSGTTEGPAAKSDGLPECGFTHIGGCIARIFYYLFYVPTSFLFGLAGTAMDFSLMYSLSDTSYKTPFVSEGWKIVRDLCNMFFIFILLYIAFTTILDTGGSKSKGTVINVVIIGLVINFSLFATHVIIDASNILARVFYNPKIVELEQEKDGKKVAVDLDEDFKYIKISEAIVSMVNPQNLMDTKTQNITSTSNQNKEAVVTGEADGISTGSFILVTLMASIVNIMGMIAFLSITLSFIGRVVGLWIAMVLSPMAFLTFTMPEFKNTPYIGWSRWWTETTKTAFMAPVFVFFLYIILMFLESGLGIANSAQKGNLTGLNHILSITIPFILIIILLKQAQKIASDMAGEVAGMITKSIGVVGGAALGGAALGIGALGKNLIGKTMATASRGETSVQKYEAAKRAKIQYHDSSLMDNLSWQQQAKGAAASFATGGFMNKGQGSLLGSLAGKTTIAQNIKTRKVEELGVDKGLGGLVNSKQKKVGEIEKARKNYDEAAKESGLEHIPENRWTPQDLKKVKGKFKDKNKSEFENEAKNGDISLRDASGQEIRSLTNPTQAIKGERTFKADRELSVENDYITKQRSLGRTTLTHASLSKQDKAKIKDQLDVEFRAVLKTTVDHRSNEKFKETREKSKQNISMTDRGISGANKASFNPANLTNLKSDKRDSLFSRIPKTLIMAIAAGVRMGLKTTSSSLSVKTESKPQASLIKDMGDVISSAIKNLGGVSKK